MFSKALDCPQCKHRFGFDYENEFPERITCPACGVSSPSNDFSALVICSECHTKLKIPVDMLSEPDLSCPQCGTVLRVNDTFMDNGVDSTYQGPDENGRQMFRRMLQDGDFFDKYKIIRLLGKGGMAEVYLAEHLLLKQYCALKLMRSNMNSGEPIFIKRFIREAKISHSIDHPNIVKVFDAGNDFKTGFLFLAMEYVEGQTLLELSREQVLHENVLREILLAMTEALEVLERERVVHRDIKPSNIMLNTEGVYKLMDLGIAKSDRDRQDGELTLTMEQSTIGTPSYASPEQCQSAHSVDIRSDIYCLGTTIYHIATGKLPFDGASPVEIILKVMQEEPEPLETLRPDLSRDFVALIQMMMMKDPAKRPASPQELKLYLTGKKKIRNSDAWGKTVEIAKTTWHVLCEIWRILCWLYAKGKVVYKYIQEHFSKFFRFLIVVGLIILIAMNVRSLMNKTGDPGGEKMLDGVARKIVEVMDQKESEQHKNVVIPPPKPARRIQQTPVQNVPKVQKPAPPVQKKTEKVSLDSDIVFYCDFDKNIPADSAFIPSMVHDGVLNLDGVYPMSSKAVGMPYHHKRNANSISISPRQFDSQKFTFSFRVNVDPDNTADILHWWNAYHLRLAINGEKLTLIFCDKDRFETNLKLKKDGWTKISFSYDTVNREFILYGDDTFIWAHRFPQPLPWRRGFFTFYDFSKGKAFKGKVDDIIIRNSLLKKPENIEKKQGSYNIPVPHGWFSDFQTACTAAIAENKNILIVLTDSANSGVVTHTEQYVKILDNVSLIRNNYIRLFLDTAYDPENPDRFKKNRELVRDYMKERRIKQIPGCVIMTPEKKLLLDVPFLNSREVISALEKFRVSEKKISENVDVSQTVPERLSACRARLRDLRQEPLSKLRNAKIRYVESQIEALENQVAVAEKVNRVSARSYSSVKTADFKQKMKDYIKWTRSRYSQEAQKLETDVLQLMKDPAVDLNITLSIYQQNREIPLWQAVAQYVYHKKEEFVRILTERCVKIENPIISPSYLESDLFLFGQLSLMSSEDAFKVLLNKQLPAEKYHDCCYIGSSFSSEKFRKYMKLAPVLNGMRDSLGRTPMHYAAIHDDAELMIDLVLAGFTEGTEKDSNGDTPWQLALRHGSLKVAKLLEQAGLKTGNSAKDQLQFDFWESMKERDYSRVRKLLAAGADPYLPGENEMNALQNACFSGDEELVRILLLNHVDPNRYIPAAFKNNIMLDSPIWIAAARDQKQIFAMLLDKGASITETKRNGIIATLPELLARAHWKDRSADKLLAYLRLLLQYHWEINSTDHQGRTFLAYVLLTTYSKQEVADEIIHFLLKNGADPRVNCYGQPIIRFAHRKSTRELLEKYMK